jgi:hypothetical protein
LELIGIQIEQVDMKQIDKLVLGDQQGQITFILRYRQADPHPAIRQPTGPAALCFCVGSLGGSKQQKRG